MTPWKRRIIFGSGVLLAAVVALLWAMRTSTAPAVTALPVPNGYDCISKTPPFVLTSDEPPSRGDKDFSIGRAKHYVTNNEALLPIVQAALTNEWVVPIDVTDEWLTAHASHDMPQAKRIAQLFSCAGYVAETEGRLHDAAKLYLDGLKFGSAVARGGLMIDSLVSVADEHIALKPMESIAPKLSAEDCRFVLAELQNWRTNRYRFESIVEQEKKWSDVFGRVQLGLFRLEMLKVMEMVKSRSLHPEAVLVAKTRAKYESVSQQVDALRVRVAARAFELEHNTPPKSWGDLVPAYLPEVPIDPQTKRPFMHQFEQ